MCGICGVYEYQQKRPVDVPILQNMLKAIYHRGPDDEGMFLDQDLAIGMRRLSIIDVAGGKQPIWNEDKTVVTVFNGEIYNYRELRHQLQQHGHVFATNSDTEVIVHLYEEFGDECVGPLRGMFAFAVWDTLKRHLLIARDHLGIKPLYYTEMGERLVFGSEIKAILQHPHVIPRMNLEALDNYLSLRYVPAPLTMFSEIYALPPGYLLTCDPDNLQTRPYWDVSFAPDRQTHGDEESYAQQLEELLRDVVKMQLMSDVPFGAFLSGGVDSSTVVALMTHFLNEPVKTFSVGYDQGGEAFSELPYARLVAEQYHTDHHEVLLNAQDFIALMETVTWHLDQPIADYAEPAYYSVAKLASQHVKMVLTGEGGDELFAGYTRYAGERFSPLFQRIPHSVRLVALETSKKVPKFRRAKSALYALCQDDEAKRLTNWIPLFNHDQKAQLLSSELKLSLYDHSSDQPFSDYLNRTDGTDPLSRMLYVDTKLWLPDYLLARGDKLSMAVSLEGRVPLLDYKLVEFAASLPPHLKMNQLTRKYLLKKVSQKYLPPEIIRRKKQGFPAPVPMWLRTEARAFVHDLLSSHTIHKRGLFKPDYVAKLLNEHDSGFADHATLLYGLINLELWQQMFMDAPLAVPG